MAANAYREIDSGDITPLDLQLDLLVDGELPENQRRQVLLALDSPTEFAAPWRTLALRFLQRQTEQQAVRQLMAGGNLVPVEFQGPKAAHRHILGRIGPRPLLATAAGLLIAVTSAMITLYAVQSTGTALAEVHTSLPPELTSTNEAVPVTVPVVRSPNDAMVMPVSTNTEGVPVKQTLIFQSDGRAGFIMIPVTTSRTKVY
jgi:hypothetical protein